MAWYPGEDGGDAVADILWGDANPSGRLPVTFPRSVGQLPLVYNHKPTGRLDDYGDMTGEPAFPFGFGLSYTEFRYSGLTIEPGSIAPAGTARVSCQVTNAGSVAGAEVVQLYVHDPMASVARPVLELKGFRRVCPRAGRVRDGQLRPRPARAIAPRFEHEGSGRAGRIPDLCRQLLPGHPPQGHPNGQSVTAPSIRFWAFFSAYGRGT